MREMVDERTNLHYVVAQTLQWIHGLTSMEYGVYSSRVAKVTQGDETHHSFEVVTNKIRLGGIRHPMSLVAENIHVALTGVVVEIPNTLVFEKQIATIELEDMTEIFLLADNSGYSTIGVQTKIDLFSGGEEVLSRHFQYRNNLLHLIR
jgi:hypothetical protein